MSLLLLVLVLRVLLLLRILLLIRIVIRILMVVRVIRRVLLRLRILVLLRRVLLLGLDYLHPISLLLSFPYGARIRSLSLPAREDQREPGGLKAVESESFVPLSGASFVGT